MRKSVLCYTLIPHPIQTSIVPSHAIALAAGSFTQTGEPDMTTHMSNKRSGTLALPKTTLRQTTTHDNRGPRFLTEEFLAPKQSKLPTRPTPGLPCRASLPCLACQPLCLAYPSTHHHQIHPSSIYNPTPFNISSPPQGGRARRDAAGQGLNLPKRKCLAR